MEDCFHSGVGSTVITRGVGSPVTLFGVGSTIASRGRGHTCQSITQFLVEDRIVLKSINDNTTHNLSPDVWTKVPMAGTAAIITGTAGTDFTLQANELDWLCNFTGTVMAHVMIRGLGDESGLQFKIRFTVNGTEEREEMISQNEFENGVIVSVPGIPINVTSGQILSIESIRNTFSGSIIIGDSYVTLERLTS